MRQAAPFAPGDSKAGAINEGWSQFQIDTMLETEAEWKAQVLMYMYMCLYMYVCVRVGVFMNVVDLHDVGD